MVTDKPYMMIMKKTRYAVWGLYFIASSIVINSRLQAQTIAHNSINTSPFSSPIKYDDARPLSIGDRVPNLEFADLINTGKKSIRLSDYKNKVIILDFWATWCSACIKNFPKMDSLQRKFDGQLQILLINTLHTNDTKQKVSTFLDKWKKRHSSLNLPIILKDSITEVLFPHREIPHYVWIKDGIVTAITDAHEISADNISGILTGTGTKLKEKKDNMDFDWQKPLFVDGNGGSGQNFKYRSLITGYNEELPTMAGLVADENSLKSENDRLYTRIFCFNSTIVGLYKHAFPEISDYPLNRIILNVNDASKFYHQGEWTDNWKFSNAYVYELIAPPTTLENIRKQMLQELNRFFNLSTSLETKLVKCLFLVKTGKDIPVATGREEPENSLYETDDKPKNIQNQNISVLVRRLNDLYKLPVVDETNFTSKVNINLPANLSDLVELKKQLNKYGFDLVETEKELKMFVLSEITK